MQHSKRSLLSNTLPLSIGVNFVLTLFSCIAACPAKAQITTQITPDATLGDKSSVVVEGKLEGSDIEQINGGAIQGSNLFHSFKEFNIGEGGKAYFTNPGEITNILTRVTGGQESRILGTLGVLGPANLFLINPNGIIFGPNALLNMGGSFVASTADSLVFDNGLEFSATNPLSPPLLTVNIPVGLRLRENSASIVNQSSAVLYLPSGNTLGLVGGNVILDGGSLGVPGGRIELGGLTGTTGIVGFNVQDAQGIPRVASLSFPNGVERADVSLSADVSFSKPAVVNVAGGSGGSIAINGRNVNIVEGSRLLAGIDRNLGLPEPQAGNIEINATDQVVFSGASSGALNQVEAGVQGNSGDINIQAGSFEVSDGAQLSASTKGSGNAGTIRVTATNQAVIDGQSVTDPRSSLFSQVEKGAVGKSGGIQINAGSVAITNGAQLSASTSGEGDAGKISIDVRDQVLVDGESIYNNLSQVFSQVEQGAIGKSGGIEIKAGSVAITNGAQLSASTSGEGDAGKISIDVRDRVLVDGESEKNFLSAVFSQVEPGAVGNSGGIEIDAGSVAITKGAQLSASTSGQQGNAGKISITARDRVLVDGESENNFRSAVFSQVEPGAVGNSGGIEIDAGSVTITKGAQLSASTSGQQGNAGKISITARDGVLIDGESENNFRSAVLSQVEQGAVGNSGGIEIDAGSVAITKGAQLSASTSGQQGNAGKISITARDRVLVDGESKRNFLSTVFSQVEKGAVGNSGGIEIDAGSVDITKGAQLSASTSGEGNAGKISITARDRVLVDGESENNFRSTVFSQVEQGAVGNSGGIEINTPILEVRNGGSLDASTKSSGDAGTISITASDKVIFDGESSSNLRTYALSQVFDGANGNSGGIVINAPILEVTNGAFLDASTRSSGNAGTITINANDKVIFDGESSQGNGSAATSQVTNTAEGKSGGIEINAPILRVTNGAELNTTTLGKGNSGAIRVAATDSVVVDGTSRDRSLVSAIASEVGTGATGASEGIIINAPRLQISNAAIVSANTNGNGNAGNIDVTSDTIELSSAGKIRTNTSASSKAGNITLNVPNSLALSDFGTAVLAETENTSTSDGGNIFVIGSPKNVLIQNGAALSVNSRGSGIGGDISLKANSLTLDQGTISAETAKERGGNITLEVADLLQMQGESKITTNAGIESQPGAIGNGGNIKINTQFLVASPSKPKGSDITANATYGNGGRVDITAAGIFGIEFGDKPRDRLNEITASSEFGVEGVVNFNLQIDPSQNLVELPANVVDPNDQIAQNPCSKGVASEFTITGRGGLPPSPNEDLSQEATQVALVEPVSIVSNVKPPQKTSSSDNSKSQIPSPIVPVKGWVFNNKGEVVLTAYNPNVTGTHRLPKNLSSCPAR